MPVVHFVRLCHLCLSVVYTYMFMKFVDTSECKIWLDLATICQRNIAK